MNELSFKVFLEQNEFDSEFKLLSEAVMANEGVFGDIAFGLAAPFKALGGAATNVIGQTAKGLGNLAVGAGKGAIGLGQAAAGGLQLLGGGKGGFAKVGRGLATAASGAGTALKGAAQIGAMPVTAAIRGVQAAGEDTSQTGQFFMGDKKRNFLQKTFGLNRWDKQAKGDQEAPQTEQPTYDFMLKAYQGAAKRGDKKTAQGILGKMQQYYPNEYKALTQKASPQTAGVPSFRGYAQAYNQALQAGDQAKAKMLQAQMKQYHPKEYQAAIQRARAQKATKTAA